LEQIASASGDLIAALTQLAYQALIARLGVQGFNGVLDLSRACDPDVSLVYLRGLSGAVLIVASDEIVVLLRDRLGRNMAATGAEEGVCREKRREQRRRFASNHARQSSAITSLETAREWWAESARQCLDLHLARTTQAVKPISMINCESRLSIAG
jgi:hypothetical protein